MNRIKRRETAKIPGGQQISISRKAKKSKKWRYSKISGGLDSNCDYGICDIESEMHNMGPDDHVLYIWE